ncbi:MAG: Fe-S-containing hydro-lyase [Lachnospiraceae bacterium]|nr:Fe-S-containing hydro-lyase [Candidatus Equihabitans merdae]
MENDKIVINLPLTEEVAVSLKAGDRVLLNGIIYAARDEAHENMVELLKHGEDLPIDIKDATVYYVGPAPAKPGAVIGSAGPTTSGRMDAYTPTLLDIGLRGMIGKGERTDDVIESMKRNKAVYFGATGGAGALLAKCIKAQRTIAWPELGPEALREFVVENMPLTVVIDSQGHDLYREH